LFKIIVENVKKEAERDFPLSRLQRLCVALRAGRENISIGFLGAEQMPPHHLSRP